MTYNNSVPLSWNDYVDHTHTYEDYNEAVKQLIEAHQEEFDIIHDAVKVANELKRKKSEYYDGKISFRDADLYIYSADSGGYLKLTTDCNIKLYPASDTNLKIKDDST
jgi:hypothetical protein